MTTTVTMTKEEVRKFIYQWPCSGLPIASVWFSFDTNGDLNDYGSDEVNNWDERDVDGAALSALADDAKAKINANKAS